MFDSINIHTNIYIIIHIRIPVIKHYIYYFFSEFSTSLRISAIIVNTFYGNNLFFNIWLSSNSMTYFYLPISYNADISDQFTKFYFLLKSEHLSVSL